MSHDERKVRSLYKFLRDDLNRYLVDFALVDSYFNFIIDWMLDSVAEALTKELRYISKDLYEKGEKYAQDMVEKLFEYYSFHHTVSGRRTARG